MSGWALVAAGLWTGGTALAVVAVAILLGSLQAGLESWRGARHGWPDADEQATRCLVLCVLGAGAGATAMVCIGVAMEMLR